MTRGDEGLGFLLRYENVAWYEDGTVRILDRRVYPMKTEFVVCRDHGEVARAIADMVTQSGGPYMAAGMGMALAAWEARGRGAEDTLAHLEKAARSLSHARPTTAAGMSYITDRSLAAARKALAEGKSGPALAAALRDHILGWVEEKYARFAVIGGYVADLIPKNGVVMTQCFAETVVGTMLRACRRRGSEVHVICPETRPYFQGSRLTASVARDMGFDTTVITDNMPGYVLRKKRVDLFTSAADVITMDGHVVNKIGTFQIALAAHYWGVPYFVTGFPNESHPTADSVVIEERDPRLVTEALGRRTAMEGVRGYYPAFDVTPPKLVDGVVTDRGIYSPWDLRRYFADSGPGFFS